MRQDALLMMLIGLMAALACGLAAWVAWRHFFSGRSREGTRTADDDFRTLRYRLGQNAPWRVKLLAVAEFAGALLNKTGLTAALVARYAAAGWPGHYSDNQIAGLVLLPALPVALLLAVTGLWLPPMFLLSPFIGFGAGYIAIKQWISGRREEYCRALANTLPYVMDLIVMAMRAGASFLMTLEMVVDSYGGTAAGQEFSLVMEKINKGMAIADAVATFKQRFPLLPVVDTFADDVINSNRYGNPLADILENSAHRFKELRIQNAREQAGKAKVKIMAPGVLILLGSLLLLFGPFGIKFIKGGGLNGVTADTGFINNGE